MTPALPRTPAELTALLDAVEARARRAALADGMDVQRKAFEAAFALVNPILKAFDPSEKRGGDGKWTAGGGSGVSPDTPAHPDHDSPARDLAAGLAEKLPPGVWDKVGDKVLTAAAHVYGVMLRATPAAMRAMHWFEELGDTPHDLTRLGYAPATAGTASAAGTARMDPLRNATGGLVSTHVAATVASHLLGRAYVAAKRKLSGQTKAYTDGYAEAGALVAEVLGAVHDALGLDPAGVPTPEQIAAALRGQGGAVEKSFDPSEKRDAGGRWTAGSGAAAPLGAGERSRQVLDVPDRFGGDDAFDVKVITNPTPDEIRSKLENLRPSQPIRGVIDGDDLHIWWEQDVHHQPAAEALGAPRLIGHEDRLFITRDRDNGRVMVETHRPNERVRKWAFGHGFGYGGEYPEEPDDEDMDEGGDAVEKAFSPSVVKAWREEDHPRGDDGHFVSKDDLDAAKTDPAKAAELRKRVTDPEQRKKLDAHLGGGAATDQTPVRADQSGTTASHGVSSDADQVGTDDSQPSAPDRVQASHDAIKAHLAGTAPDRHKRIAELLAGHTVAELHELKRQLGLKASGNKADLVNKISLRAAGMTVPTEGYTGRLRGRDGSVQIWQRGRQIGTVPAGNPSSGDPGERVDAGQAHDHIRQLHAAGTLHTPDGRRQLADLMLNRMTVADLHDLKRRMGLKASGRKAELVRKLTERAGGAVRREDALEASARERDLADAMASREPADTFRTDAHAVEAEEAAVDKRDRMRAWANDKPGSVAAEEATRRAQGRVGAGRDAGVTPKPGGKPAAGDAATPAEAWDKLPDGEHMNDTFAVTRPDGSRAFGKTVPTKAEADAEEVASRLAAALGVPSPRSAATTRGGSPAVVSDWLDAKPLLGHKGGRAALAGMTPDERAGHVLMTYLAADQDRGEQNYMLGPDGRVHAIDHGGAFDPDYGTGHVPGARAANLSAPFRAGAKLSSPVPKDVLAKAAAAGKQMVADLRAKGMTAAADSAAERVRVVEAAAALPTPTYADVIGDAPAKQPPAPLTLGSLRDAATRDKVAGIERAASADGVPEHIAALNAHGVGNDALRALAKEHAAGGIDPAAVLADAVQARTGKTYTSGGQTRPWPAADTSPADVAEAARRHRAKKS